MGLPPPVASVICGKRTRKLQKVGFFFYYSVFLSRSIIWFEKLKMHWRIKCLKIKNKTLSRDVPDTEQLLCPWHTQPQFLVPRNYLHLALGARIQCQVPLVCIAEKMGSSTGQRQWKDEVWPIAGLPHCCPLIQPVSEQAEVIGAAAVTGLDMITPVAFIAWCPCISLLYTIGNVEKKNESLLTGD